MSDIDLVEREMTQAEYDRMMDGFRQYGREYGNPPDIADRFGFVATENGAYIGSVSGLAYKKAVGYSEWFYLTDLFVSKGYRGRRLGATMLNRLESRLISLDIPHIWTWTAGYEAPGFYLKQGYKIFVEMENWYTSGHSRIGLQKRLIDDRLQGATI